MRYLVTFIAVLVVAVVVAISAYMNWRFGQSIATGLNGEAYGILFGAADVFKAALPVLIVLALARNLYGTALIGSVVFLALTALSVTSAIGLYSLSRDHLAGDMKGQKADHARIKGELQRVRAEMRVLPTVPPVGAVQAEIKKLKLDYRYGTSRKCSRIRRGSERRLCGLIAAAEGRLSTAREVARLRVKEAKIAADLAGLDMGRVLRSVDPQSEAIARVVEREPEAIRSAIAVLVAVVIELVSGFGMRLALAGVRIEAAPAAPVAPPAPTVKAEEKPKRKAKRASAAGNSIAEYANDRFVSGKALGKRTEVREVRRDYVSWCEARGVEPLSMKKFGNDLVELCESLDVRALKSGGNMSLIDVELAA